MSKFIKRIGTKAYKFHVDIYLKRFEINVVSPTKGETCSCLVIFKRGEHTIKTKSQVPLNNKEAVFSEVISHISTLYYSKKSKKFLPKSANLEVMLIFREKDHKFAGTVTFDLASFPNSGVKKSLQVVNLEKCPDKDAKLSFEIRIKKLGEVEDPENDTSFIQSNQPLKSRKSQKTAKTTQNPEKSPQKNTEKILKKSQTNVTNTSSSRLETTGTSAKLGNINKKPVSSENLPKKSAQTANKPNNIAKNNKNSSSSSSSSNSSQNSGSSYSGSGSGSEEESSSPSGNSLRNAGVSSQRPALIKKTAPQNNSTPINLSENTGKTLKTTNNLNTFCNNNNNNINELDLSNAKSTHTVNSDDHLSQQIKSLLKDSAHGSKESAKLDLFLRKDERYAKKPSKGSEDEEDEMFAEFSAQKIKQLELKLSAKLKENSENLEKIRELQGENIQLREELCTTKQELSDLRTKNSRISVGTPTFEAQICEKDNEVKTLRLENLELRNAIRLKDLEIKEKNVSFKANNNSSEIEKLKELLENKEKALEEAESQLIASKAGLETLKNSRTSNSKEEFFKKKLEAANQEVFIVKNQLEDESNAFEMQKFELEQEKQRLLLENQRLSQIKASASGFGDKEKSSCAKMERENAELQGKIQELMKENAENKEKMLIFEQEIQRTKTKLGEVLNVALEMGGIELVELLEAAIIDTRLSMK